jgi:GxxExxY protein
VGANGRATQETDVNAISGAIIGACIEIHRTLGPGLLESAYQECLCYELSTLGLRFEREKPLPVQYKAVRLACGYRLDLVVEDLVIVDLKNVERILPIHSAQLLTYLRTMNLPLGLLVNFNVPVLTHGIKRIAN